MTTITLQHHTFYGKTWAAKIQGRSEKFGFNRDFCDRVSDTLSRSGKTGSITFALDEDGIYQVSESSRKRDIRRFIKVDGGTITELTDEEASALIA